MSSISRITTLVALGLASLAVGIPTASAGGDAGATTTIALPAPKPPTANPTSTRGAKCVNTDWEIFCSWPNGTWVACGIDKNGVAFGCTYERP